VHFWQKNSSKVQLYVTKTLQFAEKTHQNASDSSYLKSTKISPFFHISNPKSGIIWSTKPQFVHFSILEYPQIMLIARARKRAQPRFFDLDGGKFLTGFPDETVNAIVPIFWNRHLYSIPSDQFQIGVYTSIFAKFSSHVIRYSVFKLDLQFTSLDMPQYDDL